MALHEETVHDPNRGKVVNGQPGRLPGPRERRHPARSTACSSTRRTSTINPLGAKGIGELGITGAAAAVANAVFHATGKRVRDLPIRLDKLLDNA